MLQRKLLKGALLLVAALALSACFGGPSAPGQSRADDNPGAGVSAAAAAAIAEATPSIGVNSFLWRASLDTLKFMPLASADPFGGVIITDWYSDPTTPNERFKATVYILDTRLRADALNVSMFRQVRGANGWHDATVDPDTEIQIENAILRARAPASPQHARQLTRHQRRFCQHQSASKGADETMSRYNHREVEPKWRERWAAAEIDRALSPDEAKGKPKAYILEMFPYPSGRIHVGHSRNYTMGDVIARFRRANGYNVLHPMGWDAFGLPAENAAMERGIHPKGWTYDNIAAMREQLKLLGLAIDWSREFATCDASYYKHQQAMFLAFWNKGLVYRKKQKVNWDPVDNTVLANEQVVDGKGWRSGAPVETRELEQWMFRVTAYADDLLDAIRKLDKWPDKVRLMQGNWIGKSQGAKIWWDIASAPSTSCRCCREGERCHARDPIEVFTTRPDTLFGASFLALAPDHPLTKAIAEHNPAVAKFIADCATLGTSEADIEKAEKVGIDLGIRVKHPFDRSWELPVWAANFVLSHLRHGRDFRLARRRSARPGFRQQVQIAVQAGGAAAGRGCGHARDHRRSLSPAKALPTIRASSMALPTKRRDRARHRRIGEARKRAKRRRNSGCAIGACRGSVIGAARFRRSIAASAAWFRFRKRICRSRCRRT